MKSHICLLAGGIGTRFYPLSTSTKPKQFLDILGTGKSLLQSTYERFLPLTDPQNMMILTALDYQEHVQNDFPTMSTNNIFAEPERKNSAPPILLSALMAYEYDPDSMLLFSPSDHTIHNITLFHKEVEHALEMASKYNKLVILGVNPTHPHTGYGYICAGEMVEYDAYKVSRFVEKPSLEHAIELLSAGKYLWNSGMFIGTARVFLERFKQYAPDLYELFTTNTYEEAYKKCNSIAFDYAVLEHDKDVLVCPLSCGWNDIGTWSSLYNELPKDDNNNACKGYVKVINSTDSLLINTTNKPLSVADMHGAAVIYTDNGMLVLDNMHDEKTARSIGEAFKDKLID